MDTTDIVAGIDAEIARLQEARALLSGTTTKIKGRKPTKATAFAFGTNVKPRKRTMSAEGRARIAAAQKARWAKAKKKG
jgi:hypothetical protein